MLFNSHIFIFVFLPLALVFYYICLKLNSPKAVKVVLIVASLIFYAFWKIGYVPILVGSIVLNFLFAQLLDRRKSKCLLSLCVALNITFLGYFKYTQFFVQILNGFHWDLSLPAIILPLGISFLTFHQISYLVDRYRGLGQRADFISYSCYVLFFPHLIAGPILNYKEIIPQFLVSKKFDYRNLNVGFMLFVVGLSYKVLIADGVAPWAHKAFEEYSTMPTLAVWLGVLAYSLQLFFDFCGYSYMAIGLGKMFDVDLPVNFNRPYAAVNIIDFWRRWHMTLSKFLKEYLYIPLGGNRLGEGKAYVNIIIVMLIGGLWHGAGWHFVAWGVLHGAYIVFNHFSEKHLRFKWPVLISQMVTFLAVLIGWVFFRAGSTSQAIAMVQKMFSGRLRIEQELALPALLLMVLFVLSRQLPEFKEFFSARESKFPGWVAAGWALLLVINILFINRQSEFLYFQF